MCILCSEPTVRYSVAEPFLVEQKFDGGYLRKRSRLNKNTNTCEALKIYFGTFEVLFNVKIVSKGGDGTWTTIIVEKKIVSFKSTEIKV